MTRAYALVQLERSTTALHHARTAEEQATRANPGDRQGIRDRRTRIQQLEKFVQHWRDRFNEYEDQ